VPLGDGDEKDKSLCVDVVPVTAPGPRSGPLARCMDMITAEEVIRRITSYFDGGVVKYLDAAEAVIALNAIENWRQALTAVESEKP
jgi:hypothetical protein